MVQGICTLCASDSELQLSHIIPRFVAKWLKRTAVGGIRSSEQPNRRIQDAPKRHLLCRDCEQLFQECERSFAEQAFAPLHRSPEEIPAAIPYGDWCLRFSVSITWRILASFAADDRFRQFPDRVRSRASEALRTWSAFLLGQMPHVGDFQQHLLPLGMLEQPGGPGSPFLNRYILRSTDYDFAGDDRDHMIFAKLGRIFLFGLIPAGRPSRQWAEATRVRVARGTIQLRGYIRLPPAIMAFVNDRADLAQRHMAAMSPEQHAKVAANLERQATINPEAELFQAWARDIELFGSPSRPGTPHKPQDA